MKFVVVAMLFAMLSASGARAQSAGPAPAGAAAAFERLLGLAGTWKVADATGDFRIVFETTANGTVLLESWMAGERRHSLTVYHLDGERLLATHYCPQGNQPRLHLEGDAAADSVAFAFLDATGLDGPDASYQHALSFDFDEGGDAVRRSERYRKGGVLQPESTLSLVRAD